MGYMFNSTEELYEKMSHGDPKCNISIGSTVYKSSCEKGDITDPGTTGEVVGSLFVEDKPCYLVKFPLGITFIVGDKITKI